jgi:hypothetical protein
MVHEIYIPFQWRDLNYMRMKVICSYIARIEKYENETESALISNVNIALPFNKIIIYIFSKGYCRHLFSQHKINFCRNFQFFGAKKGRKNSV